MPILVELTETLASAIRFSPDAALDAALCRVLDPAHYPPSVVARWALCHSTDSETLADGGIPRGVWKATCRDDWHRYVPSWMRDMSSDDEPRPEELMRLLQAKPLMDARSRAVPFGSLSSPLRLLLESICPVDELVPVFSTPGPHSGVFRGVALEKAGVFSSSGWALRFGRPAPRDLPEVLAELPRRRKRKTVKELARVRATMGHLPLNMSPGAFAAALDTARSKSKPGDDHTVIEWLRSARMGSRETRASGRGPGETLVDYLYRRHNGGVTPGDLPEKIAPAGVLIGVELEFLPPPSNPLNYDNYGTSFPYPQFFGAAYCYDGSVEDERCPGMERDNELRILLRDGNYARLHRICRALQDAGCEVNYTCGVHVHLDCRDLLPSDAIIRARRLHHALPLLAGFVSFSRIVGSRAERYCKAGTSPRLGGSDHYDPARYYAINLCSLTQHNTVEVRLHHGTLDPVVLEGWVRLLRFLFRSDCSVPQTFSELLECPGLGEAMGPRMDYLHNSRWNAAHARAMAVQMEVQALRDDSEPEVLPPPTTRPPRRSAMCVPTPAPVGSGVDAPAQLIDDFLRYVAAPPISTHPSDDWEDLWSHDPRPAADPETFVSTTSDGVLSFPRASSNDT